MQWVARTGLGVLVLAGVCTVGCTSRASQLWVHSHRHLETTTMTAEEHNQAVIRIADHDRRALADDLDLIFMTDRPSRLNRWQSR